MIALRPAAFFGAAIALSPTVQVVILGRPRAWFPLPSPALVTLPLSFAAGIVVSPVGAGGAAGGGRVGWADWERRMPFERGGGVVASGR